MQADNNPHLLSKSTLGAGVDDPPSRTISLQQLPQPSEEDLTAPDQQTEQHVYAQIKRRLQIVFSYYTSYGDRMNMQHLKSNKFHKMMSDAGIEGSTRELSRKKIDLLFCQFNKHQPNMDFAIFLKLMSRIATLLYPADSPFLSFTQLLE